MQKYVQKLIQITVNMRVKRLLCIFLLGLMKNLIIYYFENHGYNDYNIYYKSEISDEERRDL